MSHAILMNTLSPFGTIPSVSEDVIFGLRSRLVAVLETTASLSVFDFRQKPGSGLSGIYVDISEKVGTRKS